MMVGTVQRIDRYPVKSLRGERLAACAVDRRGLTGDRRWALRTEDGRLASGKSSRRFRAVEGLLGLSAAYDGEVPVVTLPGGAQVRGDAPDVSARISHALGRPLRLAAEDDVPHHDAAALHLCTTTGLAAIARLAGVAGADQRRYRPNLLLDTGAPEDDWVGRRLRIGTVELAVTEPTPRCVMVTHAQEELAHHPGLLLTLGIHRELCAGLYAEVRKTGEIRVGDPVELAAT